MKNFIDHALIAQVLANEARRQKVQCLSPEQVTAKWKSIQYKNRSPVEQAAIRARAKQNRLHIALNRTK